jgi:hypothetical protein
MPSPLREALAALEHDQWAHWTRHMLGALKEVIGLGFYEARDNNIDLSGVRDTLDRWERQIATPYADLTEAEKNSDREWADKVLAVSRAYPPVQVIRVGDVPEERIGWAEADYNEAMRQIEEAENEQILGSILRDSQLSLPFGEGS